VGHLDRRPCGERNFGPIALERDGHKLIDLQLARFSSAGSSASSANVK
jgi:hypothetical protein